MRTKTTDLSKSIKCLVRSELVVCTPEEWVRQRLLQKMLKELGFPRGLISVEKKVGKRRYDIVCFTKEMIPLLLIECKHKKIDEKTLSQALGYNDFLEAPFVALASETEIKTFWQEKKRLTSVPFLPKFEEMYAISKRL